MADGRSTRLSNEDLFVGGEEAIGYSFALKHTNAPEIFCPDFNLCTVLLFEIFPKVKESSLCAVLPAFMVNSL